MEKIVIATVQAPAAIGPYSQAIRMGEYLFLSGQIPINPETGDVVSASFAEQVRQVLRNIEHILYAAETNLGSVVKTTVFLKDMQQFAEMNAIYAEYFQSNPPARSTIQVARLPKDVAIEIDAIAYVGREG